MADVVVVGGCCCCKRGKRMRDVRELCLGFLTFPPGHLFLPLQLSRSFLLSSSSSLPTFLVSFIAPSRKDISQSDKGQALSPAGRALRYLEVVILVLEVCVSKHDVCVIKLGACIVPGLCSSGSQFSQPPVPPPDRQQIVQNVFIKKSLGFKPTTTWVEAPIPANSINQ